MTIPIDHPRVHGYDRTIVIVRGDALPPELLPTRLPREADRHTVIVAADPPVELAALVELLSRHLPVRCESIRLVLSDAGQPGVAQVIADQLRIEVLAPTGPVMLLRTGMLFVVDGTWWCFRPGEPAQREGARHPAPDWQRLLPPTLRAVPAGLRVTAIPAGLWVHHAEQSEAELTAALLSVYVDAEQPTVVIGRPGTPALAPEPVYDLLESLPRPLRRRLVLVPYGAESATADTVGEWLAARTGGTVEVMSGVADTDSDGATVRTTLDASGEPGWRPFAQRLVYRAGATPQVTEWRRPLPDVPGTGGIQRIDERWAIEVVRSGLWLRSAAPDPEQDLVRRLPIDANHPLLVLGAAVVAAPTQARSAIDTVVGALPATVTGALRLVVTSPPDTGAPAWTALTARFGPLLAVVGPGHLVELPAPETNSGAEQEASSTAGDPSPDQEVPPSTEVPAVQVPAAEVTLADVPVVSLPVVAQEPRRPGLRPGRLVVSQTADPLPVPGRHSDPSERQVLRELLGDRYPGYAEIVTRSPRGQADGRDGDAVLTDLATVVAFVDGDELFDTAGYADTDTAAEGQPDAVRREVASCLHSGLLRLPVQPGPVFASWAVPEPVAGEVLHTTDVLAAAVSPYRWEPGRAVPVVWSTAGRNTAGVTPAGRECVLFPAGTRFQVVGLDHLDRPGPAFVLLRELEAGEPAGGPATPEGEAADRRAREGLRRAVEAVRRAATAAGRPSALVADGE
ncbi:hypothetical protein AB0J90_24500 [Micromonospora sp. NPDC049523]|uniref:hypothetical protein n=1 Tax=Micromonospora sp. NPDC049523 TaxID=3155921 RepID=UPI003449F21C